MIEDLTRLMTRAARNRSWVPAFGLAALVLASGSIAGCGGGQEIAPRAAASLRSSNQASTTTKTVATSQTDAVATEWETSWHPNALLANLMALDDDLGAIGAAYDYVGQMDTAVPQLDYDNDTLMSKISTARRLPPFPDARVARILHVELTEMQGLADADEKCSRALRGAMVDQDLTKMENAATDADNEALRGMNYIGSIEKDDSRLGRLNPSL